jgi:hypothetical protein
MQDDSGSAAILAHLAYTLSGIERWSVAESLRTPQPTLAIAAGELPHRDRTREQGSQRIRAETARFDGRTRRFPCCLSSGRTRTAHAATAVRECNGHEPDPVFSGRLHCASARNPRGRGTSQKQIAQCRNRSPNLSAIRTWRHLHVYFARLQARRNPASDGFLTAAT